MTAGRSLPPLLAQGFTFASRDVIYVACNWPDLPGGVWKSIDGGREWSQLPTPKPPQGDAGFIGVFPLSEDVVFAHGGRGLLVKTTDGGETWQSLMDEKEGPGDNNGLWARNERDVWVARDNNLLYHTWGGENLWEEYRPVQDGGWVVHVEVVGRSVWVAASANSVNSGGFAFSPDYGATWMTPTTDLPPAVHAQFNSLSLQPVM